MKKNKIIFFVLVIFLLHEDVNAQKVLLTDVGQGWAGNSINAVVFRKNSLVSFNEYQFISYYDPEGYVVVGKRKWTENKWELKKTVYKGGIKDAHNSISIMIDGDGYLHLAWDQHNNPLNYCRSKEPLSIDMAEKITMTGVSERSVSYPEFYKMPDGELLFFYRDGGSGRGNLIINKYNTRGKKWTQLHNNLIDGESKRSAYWQACVDKKGTIHISWVWRESPDVASNHDMCYARSGDGGITWENSDGLKYSLPITVSSAELIYAIPQKSELINQTSMCTDDNNQPIIASYWRDANQSVPQYHVVYRKDGKWQVQNMGFRKAPFSLSGGGTKQIPISRPQVIARTRGAKTSVTMIFKDEERQGRVSVAVNKNLKRNKWRIKDLTTASYGAWEPSYDTELWKQQGVLSLYLQHVVQVDGEGVSKIIPQPVQTLDWKP
jgi:hypothetical protein